LVSLPRRVGGELYGSFLPGSQENLQRALNGLLEFLPAGAWTEHATDHARVSYRG
jgi:ESX secretion-associated protein EspG